MPEQSTAAASGDARPIVAQAASLVSADASRQSLLGELETAIAGHGGRFPRDSLRRITDLFVLAGGRLSPEQVAVFADVMGRLSAEIDLPHRAEFAERLATIIDAPPALCRALALDEAVEVAGPLLARSEQVDEDTLIICARTRSQEHLLAISQRAALSEGVTDILAERGDLRVVANTAKNSGARFSEFGYSTLVTRAEGDDELALTIWARPGIPRKHLLALFAQASDAMRVKFQLADPRRAALTADMFARAADGIRAQIRARSRGFVTTQAEVTALHRSGGLTDKRIRQFAHAGDFDAVVVALALYSGLSVAAIERLFAADYDQTLILAKAIDLSWEAAKAILLMQVHGNGRPAPSLDACFATFRKLKPETVRGAMEFYRSREQANI